MEQNKLEVKIMSVELKATIEDLYKVANNGKAELLAGELKIMSPTGDAPNYAAGEIFASLRQYSKDNKFGRAVTDNAGFRVNLPNRDSFSPDVAFYIGKPSGMKFFEGAPIFAVEVRSENDYGPKAEEEMAKKRLDYFAAGTLVVWDVDLLATDIIKVYRATNPTVPTIYRREDLAEAEPAIAGWQISVDELFEF
jgi:Uma2 family endonuclease